MGDKGDIMVCKICGSHSVFMHEAKILAKYSVKYYQCPKCYFLQTEEPFWLEESYQESINVSDTGYISRNVYLSRISSVLIYLLFNRKARFIDYGGGYGIFVRLMRDIGFDFYWQDAYTENIFARGFEAENAHYELVTSFETFEHFVEPNKDIQNMLGLSDNILFSTELYGKEIPAPNEWYYYGLNHGQHISFYNIKTLEHIAQRYLLNLWSDGRSLHLLTKQTINSHMVNLAYYGCKMGLAVVVKKLMDGKTIADWDLLRTYGKKNNI